MDLPSKVSFKAARLDEVSLQPTEDGGKAIIALSVPMSPSVAEIVNSKEMLYDEKGLAREFTGSIGIPLTVADSHVSVNGEGFEFSFSPEKVRAFRFGHGDEKKDESDGDSRLRLSFRVHLSILSDIDRAYELFHKINKGTFSCVLEARQKELFAQSEADDVYAASEAEN